MREVRIINVRHGSGERARAVYASLIDANTGELIVAGTLSFILDRVICTNHKLIGDPIESCPYL